MYRRCIFRYFGLGRNSRKRITPSEVWALYARCEGAEDRLQSLRHIIKYNARNIWIRSAFFSDLLRNWISRCENGSVPISAASDSNDVAIEASNAKRKMKEYTLKKKNWQRIKNLAKLVPWGAIENERGRYDLTISWESRGNVPNCQFTISPIQCIIFYRYHVWRLEIIHIRQWLWWKPRQSMCVSLCQHTR